MRLGLVEVQGADGLRRQAAEAFAQLLDAGARLGVGQDAQREGEFGGADVVALLDGEAEADGAEVEFGVLPVHPARTRRKKS